MHYRKLYNAKRVSTSKWRGLTCIYTNKQQPKIHRHRTISTYLHQKDTGNDPVVLRVPIIKRIPELLSPPWLNQQIGSPCNYPLWRGMGFQSPEIQSEREREMIRGIAVTLTDTTFSLVWQIKFDDLEFGSNGTNMKHGMNHTTANLNSAWW